MNVSNIEPDSLHFRAYLGEIFLNEQSRPCLLRVFVMISQFLQNGICFLAGQFHTSQLSDGLISSRRNSMLSCTRKNSIRQMTSCRGHFGRRNATTQPVGGRRRHGNVMRLYNHRTCLDVKLGQDYCLIVCCDEL